MDCILKTQQCTFFTQFLTSLNGLNVQGSLCRDEFVLPKAILLGLGNENKMTWDHRLVNPPPATLDVRLGYNLQLCSRFRQGHWCTAPGMAYWGVWVWCFVIGLLLQALSMTPWSSKRWSLSHTWYQNRRTKVDYWQLFSRMSWTLSKERSGALNWSPPGGEVDSNSNSRPRGNRYRIWVGHVQSLQHGGGCLEFGQKVVELMPGCSKGDFRPTVEPEIHEEQWRFCGSLPFQEYWERSGNLLSLSSCVFLDLKKATDHIPRGSWKWKNAWLLPWSWECVTITSEVVQVTQGVVHEWGQDGTWDWQTDWCCVARLLWWGVNLPPTLTYLCNTICLSSVFEVYIT